MPIEPRYIVIKRRDAHAYLTLEEQNLIHALAVNYPPPGVTAEVGACEQQA